MKKLSLLILVGLIGSCAERSKVFNADNNLSGQTISPVETRDGIVFFSENNGLTWMNMSQGLPDSIGLGLGAIAVSDESLAIATKERGVFLFDINEDRWINIPTDSDIIENNPGALVFFKDHIYVGTQKRGVFVTSDSGEHWTNIQAGLTSPTVRKLDQIGDRLYAGTNAGLFFFNEYEQKWVLEYGNNTMQVNGLTELDSSIYIATNQGAYVKPKNQEEWTRIIADRTLHNISSDEHTIYAMTYNELLSSNDKGMSWQSIQQGLPSELYTFNVIKNGFSVFAGQWDGVYRKDPTSHQWQSYSKGLPGNYAITNMKSYQGIIVVSGSERRLKEKIE